MSDFYYGLLAGAASGALVCWIVAKIIFGIVRRRVLEQLLEIQQHLSSESMPTQHTASDQPVVLVRVEEYDGIYYLYNASDNTFMTQGSSLNALEDNLNTSQWKGHHLIINDGDPLVMAQLLADGAATVGIDEITSRARTEA